MVIMHEGRPFRIAIVGGGIGGLFCALAIHHHCSGIPSEIQIDIYEQATEYKEIGAGVGVGVNAARWFHAIGLGDKLNSIASLPSGIWISFRRYDNSDDVVTIPIHDSHNIRQAPCARTDLLELLRQAIEDRQAAVLHTRKTCISVEDLRDMVRVHFKDGLHADVNVVIGCDGIHSAVRSQFTQDRPMYSGQIAYRGVIPITSLKNWHFDSYSVLWLAKHKHFLVFPISQDTKLNIVAFVTKAEREVADVKESWTAICERKDVEADFEHFDEPVQQIISQMPEKPSKWRLNDRELLHRWHYMGGKAILLGDAAHPMLPHLGAGLGQAVEDGWVLGCVLRDYLWPGTENTFTSLEASAQFYQDVRLPRAQKTQATSRVAGDTYEMQTADLYGKGFEECLPIIAQRTAERMKWVWEEDLDQRYNTMREQLLR